MYDFRLSGTSSNGKIAPTGQAGSQAPQSIQSSGFMNSWSTFAKSASSGLGCIQSTGHTWTQEVSFTPIHASVITLGINTS